MGAILLGVVALICVIFLARAFIGTDPKELIKAARSIGAGALGLAAIGLLLVDRPFSAVFVGLVAWGLYTGGQLVPGIWPRYRFTAGRASASAKGQTSSVRTSWIEMELDHDSGDMRGTILQGPRAGKSLHELDRDALMAFYAEAGSADGETRRLLEAYLARAIGPDWQSSTPKTEPPPVAEPSSMTHSEALSVLGLRDGASEIEIHEAHRRLMMQNHPDHGGSNYLASKINEAKDVLLSAMPPAP